MCVFDFRARTERSEQSAMTSPSRNSMIHFALIQNRQGKTRLSKWYAPYENSEKRSVEREVHRLVVNRDVKFTNFIEYRTFRIVYRRYAGLYFSFCVDIADNEFANLEAIHFFVELLDKY